PNVRERRTATVKPGLRTSRRSARTDSQRNVSNGIRRSRLGVHRKLTWYLQRRASQNETSGENSCRKFPRLKRKWRSSGSAPRNNIGALSHRGTTFR